MKSWLGLEAQQLLFRLHTASGGLALVNDQGKLQILALIRFFLLHNYTKKSFRGHQLLLQKKERKNLTVERSIS